MFFEKNYIFRWIFEKSSFYKSLNFLKTCNKPVIRYKGLDILYKKIHFSINLKGDLCYTENDVVLSGKSMIFRAIYGKEFNAVCLIF